MAYRSPYRISDDQYTVPSRPYLHYELGIVEKFPGFKSTISKNFIPAGAVIFYDGGIVVSSIMDVFPEKKYAVLIDDGVWLSPSDYDNLEVTYFINHNCESNIGRIGGLVYFAKRDIKPNEELTIDYAPLTSDFPDWALECKCGSNVCRKIITSHDYLNPKVAQDLWQEWLPFVQKKISSIGK